MSETTQERVEHDPDEHPLAERLAAAFHRHYEDLAPLYGYKTREASAVPWEDVPENNKLLMIAVADTILRDPASPLVHLLDTAIEERDEALRVLRKIAECECPTGSRCPVHGVSGPNTWEEMTRAFYGEALRTLTKLERGTGE